MSTVRPNFQNMLAQRLGVPGAPTQPLPAGPMQPVIGPVYGGTPAPVNPIARPQPIFGGQPGAPPVGPVARPVGPTPFVPQANAPAMANPPAQNMLRQRMGLQ